MLNEFPIGIDTETTGVDIWHGCRPFFVSTFDPNIEDDDDQLFWEWDVNPYTRTPIIPFAQVGALRSFIAKNRFVYHNRKFEQRALESIKVDLTNWQDEDTLVASHVLNSSGSHKLKDLGLEICDIRVDDQTDLMRTVNECRRIGKSLGWRIAGEGDSHFPAWKPKKKKNENEAGWWVADMWLPRAVARHKNLPVSYLPNGVINSTESHPYWSVCRRYAMQDAKRTLLLWLAYYEALHEEGLVGQYLERRKLLECTYAMEKRGVPVKVEAVEATKTKCSLKADKATAKCFRLVPDKIENLASPKQLQTVLFDYLKVPPTVATKTGYSTEKKHLEQYLKESNPHTLPHQFVANLLRARKYTTGIKYLTSYEKYACPVPLSYFASPCLPPGNRFFILRPNINTTGTRTTRFSSSDPNEQNISKAQEDGGVQEFNLRDVFCPLPGREFFSGDYSNIEMRLFAYQSGDKQMIEAFETGYKVHLIIAELLYPEEFAKCTREGKDFSQVYEATLYQWIKNGNFALIYGAQKKKADATYHYPGAYELIRQRMPKIDEFMTIIGSQAKRKSYITTMGGYRLYVPPKKPHAALNYYIQGSAGEYLALAMNKIHDYLSTIPDHYMMMTVHDELDFDVPIQTDFRVISKLASIMEESGDVLGVPVPVAFERHPESWAEGVKLDKAYPDWRLAV